jgi:hypothetical protein
MEENLASYDTELFIEEVKNRPAIWDMESAEYTNRTLKRVAWQQLVEMFSAEGTSKEELKHFGHPQLFPTTHQTMKSTSVSS